MWGVGTRTVFVALLLAGAAVRLSMDDAALVRNRLGLHWRQTPEEMAVDIGRDLGTHASKTHGMATFLSATAHGKTVKMLYSIADAANFELTKARAHVLKGVLIPSVCTMRTGAFEGGVVVLIVYSGPAGERVEITIDQAACASVTEAGMLAGMAVLVANLENENKDARNKALARTSFARFRFDGATVRAGGVVENRYVADGAELTLGIPQDSRPEMEKFFREVSCNSSQTVLIQKGGAIHHLIVRADGTVLMRFTADKSSC